MSDDLTSALNDYLSHYPDASDKLKKDIADTLIDNIRRSIPNRAFGTFSSGPDDKKANDKIRFVQEYLKSVGMTPVRVESYANSGTRMIHFEPSPQPQRDLSTSASSPFAKHVSETVDRIAGEKVRLYGLGSNPKVLTSDLNALQKIADRLSGDNDISFTDVGLEHAKFVPQVTIPDQNGRSHPDPDRPARWELSLEQAVKTGILEGLKFQSLSDRRVPDPVSHPHPVYGSGRLSTSARARQATAETPWEHSGNVDRSAVFTGQAVGDIPDLNNPPRWDGGGSGLPSGGGGRIPPAPPGGNGPVPQLTPEENDSRLNEFVNWTPQSSTAERAAERAEEARRIVEDIAASGGGGRIPPAPPGGNGPPGPPDEPEDDDGILRQLLDFFQRMFGVRPDIANRNMLDTLANNLTSILGGVVPQPNAEGQRPSAVATLMDTFADYFNVPRETEEATREAQETLRRSIDRLTEATNSAANGGTPAQPQGRFARFRSFFRRGRTRRGGIATATRMASFMRPLFRGIANTVPARWRQAAGQAGASVMGRLAPMLNIPATTAARFGAAMPVAALAVGVLAKAIPIIGSVITATVSGLNKLADQALKTTFALASYSGLLAHANAQLEVSREMRKFDMANRMAGFGAERLNQLNRLENALQPWQIMGGNAGNMWGTMIDSALATVVEHINRLIAVGMDLQAAILDWVPGDQGEENLRKAAANLRNPAANMPQAFEGREALFGQNAVDMIDLGKRMAGPRRPVNGGN